MLLAFSPALMGQAEFVIVPPSATGKKVKKMSVTVLDDSDAAGIAVRLRKTDLINGNNHWSVFFIGTGFYEALGKQLLHDNTTTVDRTINNRRWAWDIVVTFEFVPSPEDALRVYCVRIKYE